jgi:hypothetical protein
MQASSRGTRDLLRFNYTVELLEINPFDQNQPFSEPRKTLLPIAIGIRVTGTPEFCH